MIHRLYILVTACLFLHIHLAAQLFPGLEGQPLIDEVVLNFTPGTVMDYGAARDTMYAKIYNNMDSVSCVYTGHTLYLPSDADPSSYLYSGGASDGISTEHTWPQSLGAGDGNARSDMHHLFPVQNGVNSARENFPFGEIPDEETQNWYYLGESQSEIPTANIELYSERINGLFEPREDHKGNVARAMFYFYTIYHDEAELAAPTFFAEQKEVLCEWHFLDPVDSLELLRTHLIAERQEGKANPFVLDCTLGVRAYCGAGFGECPVDSTLSSLSSAPPIRAAEMKVSPNPATSSINLEAPLQSATLTITDLSGKQLSQQKWEAGQPIDVQHLPKGIYFLFLENEELRFSGKLVRS